MARVCLKEVAMRIRIRALVFSGLGIAGLALLLTPGIVSAHWFPEDWQNRKHDLKVCLRPSHYCPAAMAESVRAACRVWNDEHLTRSFTFTDNCDEADIQVRCMDFYGHGGTGLGFTCLYPTDAPVITSAITYINTDPFTPWGWCDDKLEIVSTIAHELGHSARLSEDPAANQSHTMRPAQDPVGHTRGLSAYDSTEAAASDTATVTSTATHPPAIQKQEEYQGTLTPAPGTPPFNLAQATSFELRAFQPQYLQIQQVQPIGNDAISWSAFLGTPEAHMLLFHLVIHYPGRATVVREGVLRATDIAWQPDWRPHAVAPADTVVPYDTSQVVLDARGSTHPAGFEMMAFRWIVDDSMIAQGGPVFPLMLPVGPHLLQLEAVDQAGISDRDTMRVLVLDTSAGVGGRPGSSSPELSLALSGPVQIGFPLKIRYRIPAEGDARFRIYDLGGRLVAEATEREVPAGSNELAWDPSRTTGPRMRGGVYFLVLHFRERQITQKFFYLR
jgi:hypothetical protein